MNILNQPRRSAFILGALGLLLIPVCLGGCKEPSFGSRLNSHQIEEISAESAVQIETQYQPAPAAATGVAEFQKIADTIASHAGRLPNDAKLNFAAIDTDEQLAVSLPDGHVYIGSALISKFAGRPSEMAAILAHEAGHIAFQHDVQNLIAALGDTNIVDMLAQGKYQDVVNTELELGRLSYTNEQEYQADRYAVHLAAACGYDASGLARVITAISDEPHTQDGVEWDLSHPISKARLARVMQDVHELAR